MPSIRLSNFTLTTALGRGNAPTLAALVSGRGGIVRKRWETVDFEACIGEVEGLDDFKLRADLAHFDCRNNRLAELALEQDGFAEAVREAIHRYGRARVGVFLGTSTSGILSSEIAYRHRDANGALPPELDYRHTHNTYSVADFVRHYFDLAGPAFVVSTASAARDSRARRRR